MKQEEIDPTQNAACHDKWSTEVKKCEKFRNDVSLHIVDARAKIAEECDPMEETGDN